MLREHDLQEAQLWVPWKFHECQHLATSLRGGGLLGNTTAPTQPPPQDDQGDDNSGNNNQGLG